MKYYVRSRFYDNGSIEVAIFLESEAHEMDKSEKVTATYDEYWDDFPSYEAAAIFCQGAKQA